MTNDNSRSECRAQHTQQGPRQKLRPPLVLPKFPNLEVFSQGESQPLCRQPETHALIRSLPGVPMSTCAQRHGHYLPTTLGTKPLCRGQDSGRKPHDLTTLNLRNKTCPRRAERGRRSGKRGRAAGVGCGPELRERRATAPRPQQCSHGHRPAWVTLAPLQVSWRLTLS